MTTKTRINGENYTQLPRVVSDDIILKGLPQTAGAPDGYGDLGEAVNSLIGWRQGELPNEVVARLPAELSGLMPIINLGRFDCNIKPNDISEISEYTDTVYVNIARTDDAGSGNQWSSAKKYLSSAITAANAKAGPTRIFVMAGVYPKIAAFGSANAAVFPNKKISIEAVYGRVQTGAFDDLTWAKTGGQVNVYEAARSSAQTAYNPLLTDQFGDYLSYTYQSSIANVDANPGSWYTDNTTVYVHAHDSSPVSNKNARVYYDNYGAYFTTVNDLYIAGFDFEGGKAPLTVTGGTNNKVLTVDCSGKYGAAGARSVMTARDGFQILGCKLWAAWDCVASSNSKDGFNVHKEGSTIPFALTVRCKGYNNGTLVSSLSNNGYTLHEGVAGVDIGGEYYYSYGTSSGHVDDDTLVYHYGARVGYTVGDTMRVAGSINYGGYGIFNGNGAMYLDSCEDVGCLVGLYTGLDANIYIRNHTGTGQRVGNITDY